MKLETLDLPLISRNPTVNKKDIQGSEIIISPNTKADLPDPIQPSILYMEASLPLQIQSLSLTKMMDYIPNPRLKRILPPPRSISQSTSPKSSDEDYTAEPNRKRTIIPIHLNPILNQHHQNHTATNNKQYDCSFCTKKFMRPSSLKIHTYSHTGEKPFKCSFAGCKRKFSVQSNMRRHLRIHLN
ncbi:hypothetical protein EDC94DRAFT_547879 [Helicostylum pulchrum]|nr:hypothetical protein EDC94DRAFT_547879 [Helicostylum pulchrum]